MFTERNETIEARPGRLLYAAPESRVFILQVKKIIEEFNQYLMG